MSERPTILKETKETLQLPGRILIGQNELTGNDSSEGQYGDILKTLTVMYVQ